MYMRVKLNIEYLTEKYNGLVITPRKLARDLGISVKTAGRILRTMELYGYAEKLSRWSYRIRKKREYTYIT